MRYLPRVSPWAVTFCPFGADISADHSAHPQYRYRYRQRAASGISEPDTDTDTDSDTDTEVRQIC